MEYIDLVNKRYLELVKSEVIYPKFKIEVVDKYEKIVLKEIVQNISQDSAGSININYQQGIRMSCSITLINNNKELVLSLDISEEGYYTIENIITSDTSMILENYPKYKREIS